MPEKNQTSLLPVLGTLLALGLMVAVFIPGIQSKNLRQSGIVTVKRLAEKNFKSDSVTWSTGVETHADSYQEVLDLLSARHKKLSKFLREQDSETAEIQISLPSVKRVYNEVRDEQGNVTRTPNGYDGSLDITVNTKELDKVRAMQQTILNLRMQNEFIRLSSPRCLPNNLENVKCDPITQVIEDAWKRAVKFVKTGGGKVGAMHSTSQGSSNIYTDSGNSKDNEYGGPYDRTIVGRQVQLVVTIEHGTE